MVPIPACRYTSRVSKNVDVIPAGTRIGPFEILSLLGAGGMGEVYRARDSRLGREVAIKFIRADAASDPERLRRFEQEARAAGALNHPNVLAVHDVGTHEGAPYLVTELLEGMTLRQKLRSGGLTLRESVDCSVQIALGLAAAHQKGVVHRDLKPENVFLTKDGGAKILDFGLAKLRGEPRAEVLAEDSETATAGTDAGVVLGTAAYMSPEQVRAQAVDHRSDIFSLGTLAFEMLSRRRPFAGETTAETMTAILKEDPPDLASLIPAPPAPLERIVRRCLEKSPENRFHSAHDLALALEAAASGERSGHRAPLPRPSRSLTRGAVAAAALALALGTVVGHVFAPSGTHPTYKRLTFRRGFVHSARFTPDGHAFVYGGMFEDRPLELFTGRIEGPGSTAVGVAGTVLGVSLRGEVAVSIDHHPFLDEGTLAVVPLSGGAPRKLLERVQWADWSPDGHELAVIYEQGGKRRLEYPIGTLLHETSGWPTHARVSPKGDRVAFLEHRDFSSIGSLSVVDRHGSKRTLSQAESHVWGLDWSPDGREIWFTTGTANSPELRAVDLRGRERLVARLAGGLVLHDLLPNGRALLTRNDERAGILVRRPHDAAERDLSWFDYSPGWDLSRDGATLLFSEFGETGGTQGTLYLRPTDGLPPVRLGEGNYSRLSPDGGRVLALKGDQLWLYPTGPGTPRQLDHLGLKALEFVWFPDSRRFVFTAADAAGARRSYVTDVDGARPRPIGLEGSWGPAVSPDGRLLATCCLPGGMAYFISPEGGDPEPVPWTESYGSLQWSANPRFLWAEDARGRVFRIEVSSGKRELFKELRPSDPVGLTRVARFRVSDDGKTYAYSYWRTLSDLYLVEGLC